MSDLKVVPDRDDMRERGPQPRLRLGERRDQILLELRLRPHVRIGELSERFGVSGETIRRDLGALSAEGLIDRAHGGASQLAHGRFPGFDERSTARVEERERIGRRAAEIILPGETVMVDSGSTTQQFARFLAFRGTPCTVVTNSLPVAMTLGRGPADVILIPGDYLPEEAAVIGADAIQYIGQFRVDRCMIGASSLDVGGPFEAVRGFAAVKRAMLARSEAAHLLIGSEKFGRRGLVSVGAMKDLTSIVTDAQPDAALRDALSLSDVDVVVAP